jgi:hypothetical protein
MPLYTHRSLFHNSTISYWLLYSTRESKNASLEPSIVVLLAWLAKRREQ